jgi:hypothetical protein
LAIFRHAADTPADKVPIRNCAAANDSNAAHTSPALRGHFRTLTKRRYGAAQGSAPNGG